MRKKQPASANHGRHPEGQLGSSSTGIGSISPDMVDVLGEGGPAAVLGDGDLLSLASSIVIVVVSPGGEVPGPDMATGRCDGVVSVGVLFSW